MEIGVRLASNSLERNVGARIRKFLLTTYYVQDAKTCWGGGAQTTAKGSPQPALQLRLLSVVAIQQS